MSNSDTHLGLLPAGFVDLMPGEAEKEAWAINTLMEIFEGYGYSRVKPPLLEFEDSLLAQGPGAVLASETFRLMDPVSHRMLGLRADITPQIARIVCTRLAQGDEPIRLTYANDVLRTRSAQMRSSRQFTQVGCEIIRDDGAQSYIEVLMLVILGLKALGIQDITIDLTIPRMLDIVVAGMGLDVQQEHDLRDMVAKRDRDGIKGLDNPVLDIITDLMDASGVAGDSLQKAKALKLPEDIGKELEKLKQVFDTMQTHLGELGIDDVSFTFDPFETKGFEYHSGIAFTAFSKSIRGELGRGGYYNVRFGNMGEGQSEKAIGFTLYMDTIRPGANNNRDSKIVAVAQDVSWKAIEALRAQGFKTLRVQDISSAPAHCDYIYKNNKPEKR